jgi:tRNA threonylcarbamoyladenosine biosynthesis protein TsaB
VLILTVRTDKPDAEIGLYDGNQQLAYEMWQAHRELSNTIHVKIEALLKGQQKSLQDIQGIVCFKGPGSFTGLRIGLTVANALAYGLQVPIVATANPRWLERGIEALERGKDEKMALPAYGAPVHTTLPKK